MSALCYILNHISFYFQIPELTKETFLALRQTCQGITGLAKYLINYFGFKYLLLGKIQSDIIEQWSSNFSSRGPCIDFFGPPRAKAKD